MSDKPKTGITIRPWADGDLPLLERLLGDPEMTKYLGGPESPEKLRTRQEKYEKLAGTGTGRMFVVLAGPEQVPAGSVGYWEREENGEMIWETGYSVLPEFQGQGIGVQATLAAIEQARAEGKHRFMHAYPSVENLPSNAVCRKAGFTLEGALEFEYPPGHMMTCNDWAIDLFADRLEANSRE